MMMGNKNYITQEEIEVNNPPEVLCKLMQIVNITPNIDPDIVIYAKDYAKKYHKNQTRKSGEPFYYHAIEVSLILITVTGDQDTIIASLLHDGVEDTKLFLPQIGLIFGNRVKYLVDRLTKLDNDVKKLSLASHENIDKLTRYKEEDKHVAYVKLSDRIHNMRTISHLPSAIKQKRISEETLKLYVPLARYLNLTSIEKELQELSFKTLNSV